MCCLASKSDCHIKKKKKQPPLVSNFASYVEILEILFKKIKRKERNTWQIGLGFHEKLSKGMLNIC